nr:MAG TPA: hypothetical protein [Caudoviricetes sp.]
MHFLRRWVDFPQILLHDKKSPQISADFSLVIL